MDEYIIIEPDYISNLELDKYIFINTVNVVNTLNTVNAVNAVNAVNDDSKPPLYADINA